VKISEMQRTHTRVRFFVTENTRLMSDNVIATGN